MPTLINKIHPKKLGRELVCRILERQVVRLRQKHDFTVIAVVGSMGKTSTKAAIARTIGATKRVVWQNGNYNDRVTVPLVIFNQKLPTLWNATAWSKIWRQNKQMINGEYPYDVVVVELGTDGPGQLAEFAYLQPDLLVVTAISPEHMEYFKTVDAVAAEELSPATFSKRILINDDDIDARYVKQYLAGHDHMAYGFESETTYCVLKRQQDDLTGQKLQLQLAKKQLEVKTVLLGLQGAKVVTAAAATADLIGLDALQIKKGLDTIEQFAGRMQILSGIKNSTLIDDTYNAAPLTVMVALEVMYRTKAPQRIAILGSMNELGEYTPDAHREVGAYCNPKKLDWVVTIGADAARYLAPVAKKQGCKVKICDSPYEAGQFVKKHLQEKAIVLAKGSQNGVFAEEAVKMLLADPHDASKLVRQSSWWLQKKDRQFPDQG